MASIQSFECEICKRPFSSKRALASHRVVHKRVPPVNQAENVVIPTQIVSPENDIDGRGLVLTQNSNENVNIGPEKPENIFVWGNKSSLEFSRDLEAVYGKIVFFRQNLFKLPSGSSGKDFIREMTRLIRAWNSKSELADIALKCVMVLPSLLLQKPSKTSKSKDHVAVLKKALIIMAKR